MRTYLSVFLIFSFFTIKAQETIVPLEEELTYEGESGTPIYFKDVNNILDKYTGNWVFDDGTYYLKISITKKMHKAKGWSPHYNDPNFEDYLSVVIIYKVNGVEIYNTSTTPPVDSLIYGNIINSSNEIELFYNEPTDSCQRQKNADLLLEFIPDGMIGSNGSLPSGTLKWTRKNRLSYISPHKECPDGSLVDSSEFKIPADLILEREQ
ncbi:DUF6705 family protein [Winogradskyella sp. SYSU M77433]|uniref:DUF6705 family protein n=1 Tax=Winogradskyella sp. SYSU M77433 TaxID=3042722 RepID=UPI002480CBA5|nr:DUF6705 family protein [Winogradskyella sp. SYSU M77433]MDH7913091.1 hypothetical protein [Winogradskyella sp. SYSU M77433]